MNTTTNNNYHEVLIVGAGAGGLAVAASLLKRRPDLGIAVIDPATEHAYQPGWTLVGGGVFKREQTRRPMASVVPKKVQHYSHAVVRFQPDEKTVEMDNGAYLH